MDGIILPMDILTIFLRQAVQNLSRRKRLEDSQRFVCLNVAEKRLFTLEPFSCSSQTAYSLRKTRISKIIEKYKNQTNQLDEFFEKIFFSSIENPLNKILTRQTSTIVVQWRKKWIKLGVRFVFVINNEIDFLFQIK